MHLREKLVSVCHKVYEKGFVAAFDGNISAATPDNTFLITRSGVCKGEVTLDDIIEVDHTGRIIKGEGKLSTEYKIHFYSYAKRKAINAVVHCHPPYSTAFALAGKSIDKHYLPEVTLSLGKIPLCKYGTPSTDELPYSLEPFIEYSSAFLLQNHGALTLGKDLDDAYYKMEKLEQAAKIIFLSEQIGTPVEISQEKIDQLIKIAERTYGISPDPRNI